MEIKDFGDMLDKKLIEHTEKTAKAVAESKADLEKRVDDLNKELGGKDATVKQIQDEIIEMKAKEGRRLEQVHKGSSIVSKIRDLISENKQFFEKPGAELVKGFEFKHWGPNESKVVGAIATANLASYDYISYLDWRPGMEPTGQTHFRDLVRTYPSATDNVQFPRAATPLGEGSFGKQTEGSAKAQIDRDWSMIDINLAPMAGYTTVSRQSLRNIIFLQEWLPTSLLDQLQDAEDLEFANGLVGAATTTASTTGFSGTPNEADKIVYYIKNLIKLKYKPNYIVVDPSIWANIVLLRPGTAKESYSLPNVITVGLDGATRIMGIPVVPVNWLTGGRILVGDFTKVGIVQSEGLTLRQSDSHASTFVANQITFLLERTEALATFRPDAFTTTTL